MEKKRLGHLSAESARGDIPALEYLPPSHHPISIPSDCRPRRRLETETDLVGLLKRWYAECQMYHGDVCNKRYTPELAAHIDSLILIDVNAGCLKVLPVSTPFIALSYVWGQADTTKLLSSNFEQLKRPGALYVDRSEMVVPNTIRDAMHLVQILDAQYLWVDCLSIMQDAESAEMQKMLRAMARIYASADFTIVAAAGSDASHGLSGIVRGAKRHSQHLLSLQPHVDEGFGYPWESTWASRGWTFQESLFSRRLLIFEGRVTWICGRCAWLEDVEDITRPEDWPAERPHLGVPVGMMSLIPKTPSLGRWGLLAEEFSSRSLTFEQDSEAAFAGATEIMGSTFPGGLVEELPLFFFDIVLLWGPDTSLTRRQGLPSWSWKGWKGRIKCLDCWYPYFSGLFRDVGEPIDWIAAGKLIPLAKYRLECASGEDLKHLNSFYDYRALREKPDAQLPDGWKRNEHPAGPFYTYASKGVDRFRYSFPLPLAKSSDRRTSSSSCQLLTCTAPVVTLTFSSSEEYCQDDLVRLPVLHHGNMIGIVTVHEEYDRDDPEWKRKARACELVAISEAELPDYFVDFVTSNDGIVSMQSIYNVLWIECKDDIAYRKGIGAIRKDAWDALKPGIRTFQLG